MQQASAIGLKWDPKNLKILTYSVEKMIEPLIRQVTTLIATKEPSKMRKGKSKRAHALVAAVEKATSHFIEKGNIIANENTMFKKDMLEAVEQVSKTGEAMSGSAREFADDPCSSAKRAAMVRDSRDLLAAVTRLLILADMIDVFMLLRSLKRVEEELARMKNANNESDLLASIRALGASMTELMKEATRRQHDLRDPDMRDALAAARATLHKHTTMLMTATSVYLKHPDSAAAKANRDYVLQQVCQAVNTISDIAQGKHDAKAGHNSPGKLAQALSDFDEQLLMSYPVGYNEESRRAALEAQLDSILSAARMVADAPGTRDDHRDRILAECDNVRQALQNLLSEYMDNMGGSGDNEGFVNALEGIGRQTQGLRRHLRKAIVDQVSDGFLEATSPLIMLTEAAEAGDKKRVKELSPQFIEHAEKLTEVAQFVCNMSPNEDGIKMVRHAAGQIKTLSHQVVNAAQLLAAHPQSKAAQDNMKVFSAAWERQVRVLTDAVDDIISVDDFLAVSESHILEDVNRCVMALEERDTNALRRTADAICGRSMRVCSVVSAEMDNYEPGNYTSMVLKAVNNLKLVVIPNFSSTITLTVNGLEDESGGKLVDDNEVIHQSQLVYDGVREIRSAVLVNRAEEELDPEEYPWEWGVATDQQSSVDDTGTLRREAIAIPEEEREKIKEQIQFFQKEKQNFDREVAKWDESGNDVVVLAKHMCVIMMEMTDFTRGRGPLKTTMDVINAAKKISEAGTKLDKLTRQIAEQCPESSTKEDLLAYLQRIALYCHQLNITSKVKADVQSISNDLIVSGLDSATSLIQAAKNLMNAVVLTVKASYVASTKYSRQAAIASPLVVWKMRAPEKKPLVRPVKPEEARARVRKASQRKSQNPIKALTEFQSPIDSI